MRRPVPVLAVLAVLLWGAVLWLRAPSPAAGPQLAETASVTLPARDVPADALPWRVVRVVDGDTFRAARDGTEETVRLIGIDTPETVKPRTPVQCFGAEASAATRRLVSGTVWLVPDPTQDTRDRYGRLLMYAWNADGTLANEALVREGFAREYTYRDAYRYQAAFRAAEAQARATRRGLWAPDACPARETPPPGTGEGV